MVGYSLSEAAERVVRIPLPHHEAERQNVRVLLVGLVEAARVIVKLNAFDSVASDEHVDLRHGAENAKVSEGLVDVALPLLRRSELLVLHQLELVGGDVAPQSVDGELVFEVHCEGLLLEWEPDIDVLARHVDEFVHVLFKLFRLGLFYALGHDD